MRAACCWGHAGCAGIACRPRRQGQQAGAVSQPPSDGEPAMYDASCGLPAASGPWLSPPILFKVEVCPPPPTLKVPRCRHLSVLPGAAAGPAGRRVALVPQPFPQLRRRPAGEPALPAYSGHALPCPGWRCWQRRHPHGHALGCRQGGQHSGCSSRGRSAQEAQQPASLTLPLRTS